jgi:DNA-binding IclR family transcriptional regulator
MPGLSLRLEQAARLFGIRARTCKVVLEDLVREGQLRRAPDGQFLL